MGSEELQELFLIPLRGRPFNHLWEIFLQMWSESLPVLIDTRVTLSVFNSTAVKQPLLQSTKTIQIVGISNEPQEVPVSEFIPFCLGPLRDTYSFLLSSSAPIHLLGWDFLEKYHARISVSQKGEIILEIDSGHQSNAPDELNDPLASFIFHLWW